MRSKISLIALVGSWLILNFATTCQAAYIVTVPPEDEECFDVSSPKVSATLFGNFDLLDDDVSALPASVLILDARDNRVMYRSRRAAKDGNFKVALIADQKVSICLQNGIGKVGIQTNVNGAKDDVDRKIGLQFTLEPKDENRELHSQNEKLVSSSLKLSREISKLQTHQDYMRAREALHRETVEETFSQLLSWALLEGLVVTVVAVGQVFYFRRFLEQRRFM